LKRERKEGGRQKPHLSKGQNKQCPKGGEGRGGEVKFDTRCLFVPRKEKKQKVGGRQKEGKRSLGTDVCRKRRGGEDSQAESFAEEGGKKKGRRII